MTSAHFEGFRRSDGSVGVRNHVLVMSVTGLTGPTARRIGRAVPGARVITTPYGSGLVEGDAALQFTLAHPAVVSAVCGYRSTSQVDTNLRWATQAIPAALWDELKAGALIPANAPTGVSPPGGRDSGAS